MRGARRRRASPDADGDILALDHNWTAAAAAAPRRAAAAPRPLPAWARRPAPPPAAATRAALALRPRRRARRSPASRPACSTEAEAMARGTAVHRLLEHLHGRPAADARRPSPRGSCPARPTSPSSSPRPRPSSTPRRSPSSSAPAASPRSTITAPLAALGGARLLGRIDRLVVEPDRVLAVDFKSHQAVPAAPEAVPEGILRQMGAYRAALGADLARPRVETAILWTRTARLMPLPPPSPPPPSPAPPDSPDSPNPCAAKDMRPQAQKIRAAPPPCRNPILRFARCDHRTCKGTAPP